MLCEIKKGCIFAVQYGEGVWLDTSSNIENNKENCNL